MYWLVIQAPPPKDGYLASQSAEWGVANIHTEGLLGCCVIVRAVSDFPHVFFCNPIVEDLDMGDHENANIQHVGPEGVMGKDGDGPKCPLQRHIWPGP